MISGHIQVGCASISDAFKDIKSAHSQFVEIAKIETEHSFVLLAVETVTSRPTLAERFWGQRVDATAFNALRNELMEWPLQSLIIEQEKSSKKITVERNRQAECMLTVLAKQNTLFLHWDPTELYRHIDMANAIDKDICAASLELLLRHSEKTFFKGVYHLLDRCKAVFDGNTLEIIRPTPIAPIEAVPLKDGVDPVEKFHELIDKTVGYWPIDPQKTGAILSSGLDTNIVAHFLNKRMDGHKLNTFGYNMVDTPDNRAAIAAMRAEGVAHLSAIDHYPLIEDNMGEAYSLSADRRWPGMTQTDFAETHLSKMMQQQGLTLAFTGIGGDELCTPTPAELQSLGLANRTKPGVDGDKVEWISLLSNRARAEMPDVTELEWPNGYVGFSAPSMASGLGTYYLRRGIWCANPLCSADIHAFTHFLPIEWRKKRHLSREALTRLGYSANFTTQLPKEGLRDSMADLMKQVNFEEIFKESILCDLGIIDRTALFSAIESIQRECITNVRIKVLIALDIERGLQSMYQGKYLTKCA